MRRVETIIFDLANIQGCWSKFGSRVVITLVQFSRPLQLPHFAAGDIAGGTDGGPLAGGS